MLLQPLVRLLFLPLLAGLLLPLHSAHANALERELEIRVEFEAHQNWDRKDEQYGHQWYKAWSRQQYLLRTPLRSEGKRYARNILDPDMDARLEAKTLFLAQQALARLAKTGVRLEDLRTDEGKTQLVKRMQEEQFACGADMSCRHQVSQQYAALFAAFEYPDALATETEPGRYLYFLPPKKCSGQAKLRLTIHIEGVRYNKSSDKHEAFVEHREADAVQDADQRPLCEYFTAVIDTEDVERPLYLENVYLPAPPGETVYTERGKTTRRKEPQPLPSAVLDWMSQTLRHASESGSATAEVPLILPLNGNATVLGLFEGTAKVKMSWRFMPAQASAPPPASP